MSHRECSCSRTKKPPGGSRLASSDRGGGVSPCPISHPTNLRRSSAQGEVRTTYGDALGDAVADGEAVTVGDGEVVVEPEPEPPAFWAASVCACWTNVCASASSDW